MLKELNKYPVIVLGLTANGLSVIRNLARHGVRVLALDNGNLQPAYFTKYAKCLKLEYDVIGNKDYWINALVNISKKLQDKAVLFPTSDKYVDFVSSERDILSKYFLFNLPDKETLDIAVSKKRLYEAALRIGIPVPKTFFAKQDKEIYKISDEVKYPSIIKPAYSHIWRKYYSQKKVEMVANPEELIKKYKEIASNHPNLELIVQEIIKGPDSNIYLLMSYFDRNSEPLAIFTPRKLRQYPVDFGIGSLDISERQERVIELGLKLLKGLKYKGLAGIEFKKDECDNEFKLMEINARTCLIGEIAIGSGVELPYIAYKDIIGEKVTPIYNFKEGVKWFGLEWDLFSFIEYKRRGQLTFWEWLNSIRGKKVYAYFAWDDILPSLISLKNIVIKIIRKLFKKPIEVLCQQ